MKHVRTADDLLTSLNEGGQDVSDVNHDDFCTDTDGDGIADDDETRSDPTSRDEEFPARIGFPETRPRSIDTLPYSGFPEARRLP